MKGLAPVILLVLGLMPARAALAAEYKFSVPEAQVTVTIEEDGSALVYYKLTFSCNRGAHPIDIVDIGMPNMAPHTPGSASVNGQPLPRSSIKISTYLKPKGCGYEIHLGPQTVRPGQTGVFEFTARERNMVWQDTTNPELASFRFTPTWFGSQYVVGNTKLILRYKLPIPKADYAAVKDDILWHKKGQEFSAKGVMEGEEVVSAAWVRTVRLTGKHVFGVSFPKRYVSAVRKDTLWGLFNRWFKDSREAQVISGIALIVIFAIIFFQTTRGTGWSVLIVLTVILGYGMYRSPTFHLCLYPIVVALGVLAYILRARRKERYFPAELCIEGGGIKRGLTSVEAAILLDVPLHKVLTMVIFGLAKKGVVRVRYDKPLKLEVTGEESPGDIWTRPDGKRGKLRHYEKGFIHAFQAQQGKTVEEINLDDAFDCLIKFTMGAMAGFDLKQTRDYYKRIVARAWKQVKTEAGYEAGFKRVDKHLGWLMLEDHWDRELRDVGGGHHYYPHWWYGRGHGTYTAAPGRAGASRGPSTPATSFGDVANSLAGRLENTCSSLAGSLDSLGRTAKGGLDLSRFDQFTSDFLSQLSEGGGSGGGGGGGCACAGCACACACAGGGR